MKKLFFAVVFVSSIIPALAQQDNTTTNPTDKGHYIVDGSVSFSINNSTSVQDNFQTKNKAFGLGLSPKVAYFVIDRLAVGIEASFGYTDNEFTGIDGVKSNSNSSGITVGPFARYYLVNGLFGQASVGFGTSKTNSDEFDTKSNLFRYQLGVGYAIFLGEQVSLEPIISYNHSKTTADQSTFETKNDGFTLGAGFTIYL
ncbi:MAG: outer membrane beta-barrel protein [Gilvibacter sp.]